MADLKALWQPTVDVQSSVKPYANGAEPVPAQVAEAAGMWEEAAPAATRPDGEWQLGRAGAQLHGVYTLAATKKGWEAVDRLPPHERRALDQVTTPL